MRKFARQNLRYEATNIARRPPCLSLAEELISAGLRLRRSPLSVAALGLLAALANLDFKARTLLQQALLLWCAEAGISLEGRVASGTLLSPSELDGRIAAASFRLPERFSGTDTSARVVQMKKGSTALSRETAANRLRAMRRFLVWLHTQPRILERRRVVDRIIDRLTSLVRTFDEDAGLLDAAH